MVAVTRIRFRDLDERERAERSRIAKRLGHLEQSSKDRKLSTEEIAEVNRLKDIQAAIKSHPTEVCDPLFVGIRDLFNETPGLLEAVLKNHAHGVLEGSTFEKKKGRLTTEGSLTKEAVVRAALTIGLTIVDGVVAPLVRVRKARAQAAAEAELEADAFDNIAGISVAGNQGDAGHFHIVSNTSDLAPFSALSSAFFAALGKAQAMQGLALLVLPLLAQEGDPRGTDDRFAGSVDAAEFAKVMNSLVEHGVTTNEQQLRRSVNQALDRLQSFGPDQVSTELGGIDFTQLEESSTSDAVKDNVKLYGTMICSAMFDELKVFQVVDTLADLFQQGTLVTSTTGDAGPLLYKYWKNAPNRMSEGERKNFYAITMGIPGGNAKMINREFNDLWLRFVSSATSFVRQTEVDKLLRSNLPKAVSHQQVRKAARDLITNLSAHGYGMALYAAVDLQDQINSMMRILNDPSVKASCGAQDPWQVIDHYAATELGGARTSTRFRTLASCGAIITSWLANNIQRILRPTGPIINIEEVLALFPNTAGPRATIEPTDYDLINACELWLADTAISDTRVDEMSQPRESPVMTSKPVQIPSIARDMLESAGVGIGMGITKGYGNGRLQP